MRRTRENKIQKDNQKVKIKKVKGHAIMGILDYKVNSLFKFFYFEIQSTIHVHVHTQRERERVQVDTKIHTSNVSLVDRLF